MAQAPRSGQAPRKRTNNTKPKTNKTKQSNKVDEYALDTKVFALGGLNEVGKNMYCVEHDDERTILEKTL